MDITGQGEASARKGNYQRQLEPARAESEAVAIEPKIRQLQENTDIELETVTEAPGDTQKQKKRKQEEEKRKQEEEKRKQEEEKRKQEEEKRKQEEE